RAEELQYLLDRNIPFDILQAPYSIFDQRFAKHFRSLKTKGIEVHVRSVFLQGLFFLDTKELSGAMEMGRDNLKKLHDISSEQDVPLQYLCLCFVLLNAYLDKVIIGVDSIDQLRQNMDFVNYMAKTEEVYGQLENLKVEDEEVILPFLWEQNKS
ncbi:MAG: aldo/keto reductase, partial [Thermodesulfovibrionia bacterium]|nr:aldo/keto reductase [Thermodesulfovibrionia bacterium]